jgi:hypothetical protein
VNTLSRGTLLTLVLLAAATACTLPFESKPIWDDSNWVSLKQATQLLEHRGRAVTRGDERAYLQDVDPRATDTLAHERMVFANLRQLSLASVQYQLWGATNGGGEGSILRVAKGVTGNPYRENVSAVPVRLMLQVRDVDSEPTPTMYWYFLGRRSGGWLILGIQPVRSSDPRDGILGHLWLPGIGENMPWDQLPLKVVRAGDATLVADSTVTDLGPWARAAPAASARTRQIWGDHPAPKGFIVFLTADTEHFRQWFGAAAPTYADGLAFPMEPIDAHETPQLRYVGARVTVNLANAMDQQPELVLRHEFTHALSFAVQVADLPAAGGLPASGMARWAVEGFARWVEAGDSQSFQQSMLAQLRAGVRAGKFSGSPPGIKQMYASTLDDTAFNYALGFSFWSFVARRWGAPRAVEAYVQYAQEGEMADTGGFSFQFTGAMGKGLGTNGSTLPRDWAAYVRQV